jgi:hypothetical protein
MQFANLLGLPDAALAHTVMPKEAFYRSGGFDTNLKQLMTDEVASIVLVGVIAPRTMNIEATEGYDEVDIIELQLKGREISTKLLTSIDASLPRPVLFVIARSSGESKYAMSYKELKHDDSHKSKVLHMYATHWAAAPPQLKGGSTGAIYKEFIRHIDPSFTGSRVTEASVMDTKAREKLQKQIDALNRQITNEPSTAKRQELARQRYALENEKSKT